ncbi:MAG: hypothetical protein JW863_08675 [Chitinispirillaceae bacterium]|nr:hypothetical protein [Chitinispirillaceae bacterium]
MRTAFILISIVLSLATVFAQNLKDVKFYNLEKEYRETETFVYEVKQAAALELKQIVGDMLSIYGSLYVNEKTNQLYITDVPEKITDLKEVIAGLDTTGLKAGNNLASKVIYLQHENVSELSGIIRHKLSPDGTLFEVPYLNAISITDVPSKIAEVEDLTALLDVPGAHIAIEITAVEFNDERFSRLGINIFNWLQGLSVHADLHGMNPGDLRNAGQYRVRSSTERYLPEDGKTINENDRSKTQHLVAEVSVADLVGFICENGDGAVLANSRIVTRNNKEAIISAREVIPYRFYENDEAERSSLEGQKAAGIYVRVLPTLQQDSLINLAIFPVISNLTGWSPKGVPIIFERTLSTEVKVKDNSVFVLGGLKKKEIVDVRRGIPGLKDIPVLQYLFSVKKQVTVEREVLLFIRPTTEVRTEMEEEQVRGLIERFRKVENRGRPTRRERRVRKQGEK